MSDNIQRMSCKTRKGNTVEFFFNPDNDLVVVDLVAKSGKGGNEILRRTLDEEALLKPLKEFLKRTKKS